MKLKTWLWAGLAVLIVGGGLVLYASARPGFAFLAGRRPSPLFLKDRQGSSGIQEELAIYTFRANWQELLDKAERELTDQGFTLGNVDRARFAQFMYPTVEDFMDKDAYGKAVLLFNDSHYRSDKGLVALALRGGKDSGWLTVVVAEKGNRGLWSRVLKWLGS